MNPLLDRQETTDRCRQLRRLASLELDSLLPHLDAKNTTELLRACAETLRDLIDENQLPPGSALNDRIGALERLIEEFTKLEPVTA